VNGINLVKNSNTVDDVFEGLTLDLKGADPDKTITVIVSEKAGDITASMTAFVEQYNSVMSVLHAQSKFNPEEDTNAPLLMGDATIRQIQTSMQRYVSGRISILGGDSLSSLGDLGVTTDSKTGQLIFDPTKLNAALNDDPTAVRRILSRFGDIVEGNNASFVGSTSATKAGTYTIDVTQARTRAQSIAQDPAVAMTADGTLQFGFINGDSRTNLQVAFKAGDSVATQIATLQETFDNRELDVTVFLDGDNKINIRHNQYGEDFRIEVTAADAGGTDTGFALEADLDKDLDNVIISSQYSSGTNLEGKINGITVTSEDDVLVGKDGFAFEDLRIRITNDFVGEAGKIRLNDGLGSSFANLIDDFIGFDGVLKTRIGSFDSVIGRIEQQMDRVTERASKLEDRLRKQFVNLEVTLGKLNATGDYLTQQLKALPGVNSNKK
jgi:flagellar hook-associated protein 2